MGFEEMKTEARHRAGRVSDHPLDLDEGALRAAATCALCHQKIGRAGPVFYRLRLISYVVDAQAVRQHSALEVMLGDPTLASVMGPGGKMARAAQCGEITVCLACCAQDASIGALIEGAESIER